MNIGKIEYSRCDDGMVMIHTEGDVLAFIDSNKASPFDEQLAERICVSFNAYDDLLAALRAMVDPSMLFGEAMSKVHAAIAAAEGGS